MGRLTGSRGIMPKGEHWRLPEYRLWQSNRMKEYLMTHPGVLSMRLKRIPKSLEHRLHLSEANTGKHPSEETKERMSLSHKHPHSEEWNRNVGKALTGKNNPMNGKTGTLNPFYGKTHTPEVIEKTRERNRILTKQWWQSPKYREKVLRGVAKATHRRPNKPELLLCEILNSAFPNEYEYSGDGKVTIFDMVPDFININGRKEVIELFGDYWHSPEIVKNQSWKRTELGRIMAYNSVGYRCLVIWERELSNKPGKELIEKIKLFSTTNKKEKSKSGNTC